MKRLMGALFLLWTGVIILAYYVVQKPGLLTAVTGLADTLWTVVVAAILLFNSYSIGKRILYLFKFETQDPIDHLLLSWGIGLGFLGLLGLLFSVTQIAKTEILTVFQIILLLFFLLRNDLNSLRAEFIALVSNLNLSFSQYNIFSKLTIFLLLILSFLLTLTPPFEGFDVLINHLAQPAVILRDGGLQAVNILPFWYPTLTENVYLWALGFGSERAPQILHLAWGLLTGLFLWHWSVKTWGIEIGRKVLLLVVTIPSFVMLASWAYADMSLTYYAVAALYALTSYRFSKTTSLLYITAILAGLAMGVKYQSFVVPLACGLILLLQRPFTAAFKSALRFSLITLLVSLPWYLRNAIFMGNPFYPFLFGGRYWDNFLATWWTDPGSGIGWNVIQLFLLPLNITLGHRDATFYDGRFGPLFLLLLPLTLWIIIRWQSSDSFQNLSLSSITFFAAVSFAAWAIGVVYTSNLWQARYLFPTVMAWSIPTALAWDSAKQFDTSKFRISFLIEVLIVISISLTIFDNAVFVIQRNPLAVAIGAQSRERYIERVNPSYAALMNIMNQLPADAHVYNLFEPRSYGLPGVVQPDPINSNFAHDVYLYKTSDAIIQHWQSERYAYVVVYERGRKFMAESAPDKVTPEIQNTLDSTLQQLRFVAQTPDKVYLLYQIP